MFGHRKITTLGVTFILSIMGVHGQGSDPAMDSYYAANALYNRNLFELAIEEYRGFIARFPRHEKILDAQFGLAFSYYNLARYQDAERLLRDLARNRDAPKREHVHNFWGQCLLILGRPAEAEAAFLWSVNRGKERLFLDLPGMGAQFQEAPELSSTSIQDLDPLERALVGLIESLFQQGKWQGVMEYTREFVELVPASEHVARVRFQSAFAMYEMRLFEAAAEVLEEIKLYHKNSVFYEHAMFLLAECQRELGNFEHAARNHTVVAREVRGDFAGNSLFRLGFIRFSQRQFAQAANDFSELRMLYPQSEYFDDAGIFLGRSYLEKGEYAQAQEVFGSLTNTQGIAAEATLWLARTFLRQSSHQEALDVLAPAIRRFNNDPLLVQFVFEYGSSLLGLQQYQEAARVFDRVATEFDEGVLTPQAMRLRAFALLSNRNFTESLTVCDRFLQRYPNDPSYRDVAFIRAENVFFLDRLDEAIRAYQQFIPWDQRTEYTDEARFRIIQILAEQQKWNESLDAIFELRREGRIEGEFFEQLDYIEGLTYFNLGRWDNAITSLERFVRAGPRRLNADIAQIKVAQAYESKRDLTRAKLALDVMIEDHPQSSHLAQAIAELGRLHYISGEEELAEQLFNRISTEFQGSPFFAQAQYYLGWIMMNRNNAQRAIGFFDRVAKDFPEHEMAADALYKQGLLYLDLNQPGSALNVLRNFRNNYPNDSRFDQASYYYGRSLSLLNQHAEAISIFNGLLGRTRDADMSARVLYELAWCHQGMSNFEAAKARYEDLLRLHPDHALARRSNFELAEIEYDEENFDAAIARLDILLAHSLDEGLRERVLNRMAWSLLGRGQDLVAAETFELLLRDFPRSRFGALAAYQAGEVRLVRREYDLAFQHFENARTHATDERVLQQAWLRQAESLTYLDRWEESERLFAAFFAKYPSSEFVRRCVMWLGWTQENLQRYEQAIANYRIVLRGGRRDELSARSQFQIGQCLIGMGEMDQAVRELVMVDVNYAYPVWSARSILEIGRILDQQDYTREANERFREVVLKFGDTEEARLARELLRERGERI